MTSTTPRPMWLRVGTVAIFAGLLPLALGGCGKKSNSFVPDLPPTVRLTHAPVASTSREVYAYRMDWVGYDPDGRVDHFLYAVDPKNADVPDTSWTNTTLNEKVIFFRASIPDEPIPTNNEHASQFHIFAIKAVDNQGVMSATVERAFYATTVAPIVSIQNPTPNQDGQIVTPSVEIDWAGLDPDGLTGKPVKYYYRLFSSHNPDFPGISDFISFASSPATVDSFRHLYAPAFGPSAFCPSCTAWDSTSPDSAVAHYTDLVPKQQYLFVVTGVDDAGAYDPIWRLDKNMLLLKISYAGTLGPVITMFNEFFNYTYTTGGSSSDPSRYVELEVPADRPVTFNWFATPPSGASMKQYRWVLDLLELDDETPRTGPNDWYHWSSWSLLTLSATIGPFDPTVKGDHLFFVEAQDNNNLLSIGIVHFRVVRPTFSTDLVVIRDLRALGKDQFTKAGGNLVLAPPTGAWPSRAELDTFMFAVGGKPWKGYPSGTLTAPGVFAGYHFDTLSTYGFFTGVVPLSTLGKYKHVLWWVDKTSAAFGNAPTDQVAGECALRFMSAPNHPSTLSTYIQQGGSVWLSGGGGALATLYDWNKRGTDLSTYDAELIPGRYMYDFAHWQSQISITTSGVMGANFNIARFGSTTPSRGWAGTHDAPDYSVMTQPLVGAPNGLLSLDLRSAAFGDEPVPPLRASTDFYPTDISTELLTLGDFIFEGVHPDGTGPAFSTLDTLFVAFLGPGGNYKPAMTLYHGWAAPALGLNHSLNLFSGFPIWNFRRVQQIALVDFVLHNIWGLNRDPVTRDAAVARAHAATTMQTVPHSTTVFRQPVSGRLSRAPRE